MRWGRRKRQISPDQVQEVKKEKQLSFLTCLLAMLLCNACSVVEESNRQPAKRQDNQEHDDSNQETQLETTQHVEAAPQPQARSVQRNLDIIRRSRNGYVQPSRMGPAVIYGLDPLVQTRRSRHMKTTKIDEKDLEGFAVAKKSSDPENDFRESMVRMIRLKRIGRPEDLENLLACYLVLNSDEYHDVIVKVFRQVWIEVSSARLRASRRPVRANRRR